MSCYCPLSLPGSLCVAVSPGSHKDKIHRLHGWPLSPGAAKCLRCPPGDTAGTGTQLAQGRTACMGTELVQTSTANVGPHSHYRDLRMEQGHAARMETLPAWGCNTRDGDPRTVWGHTARTGTQPAWGHMRGDPVEPWSTAILQGRG